LEILFPKMQNYSIRNGHVGSRIVACHRNNGGGLEHQGSGLMDVRLS